jgi:serine/threonine-protein kinase
MVRIGSVLHETYRIEQQIGKGGMGAVFLASHVRLPKKFAIKVLHADAMANHDAYQRFRREAEISSSLGHPNIIEVHDFNQTEDGEPYIVMEYLDGVDLATVLAKSALDTERALVVTRALVSALSAVHEIGVVHRDLKPQNVLVGRRAGQEVIKILDFGISKITGNTDVQTRTRDLIGTPAYMSPEQARGASSTVDARADQFSLATMVYEMLSGRRAFVTEGDQVYRVITRILTEDPSPLDTQPDAINQVLLRALSKRPEDRFADVAAFLGALEDAIAGRPVQGRTATVTAPVGLTSGHGPANTSLSGAAAEVVTEPGRRGAGRKIAALAGAVVIAAIAAVAIKRAPTTPAPAPVVAAVVPPAPAPPSKVAIRISVTPPGARVSVDGVPLATPFLELPRGSAPPTLRAEADGFVPVSQQVPTDGDRTVTIQLQPTPAAAPAARAEKPRAKAPAKKAAPVGKTEVIEDPFAK